MNPTATLRYVYLLQERDLARLGENTYKIGRSAQPRDGRIKGYPKGSHLIYMCPVKDHVKVEQEIKTAFTQSFTQMREYGVEYFQGDLSAMLSVIWEIVAKDQESTGEIPTNFVNDKTVLVQNENSDIEVPLKNPQLIDEPLASAVPKKTKSKYQCKLCEKVFADHSGLKKHNNKVISCLPKTVIQSKDTKIKTLEEENQRLNDTLRQFQSQIVESLQKTIETQKIEISCLYKALQAPMNVVTTYGDNCVINSGTTVNTAPAHEVKTI